MSHTDTERLLNSLRVRLPGATDDAIKLELFSALDEFFKETELWKEEVTFGVTPEDTTYEIVTESLANRLLWVKDDNEFTVAASMPIPGEIVLSTEPSEEKTYTACVALTVQDPTTRDNDPVFPSWVALKYWPDLVDGTLARLMSQPAKPYSSEKLAVLHMRRFRKAIANARVQGRHENLFGAQRWAFPQSFAVRRK